MCKLLGIEESQMRMWLCHKKIVTVGEVLTKPLTLTQVNLILSQVHLTVSEVNQNNYITGKSHCISGKKS